MASIGDSELREPAAAHVKDLTASMKLGLGKKAECRLVVLNEVSRSANGGEGLLEKLADERERFRSGPRGRSNDKCVAVDIFVGRLTKYE